MKILQQLLLNPDVSELEADLIVQTAIHILSGNRTTGALVDVYTKTRNKDLNVILSLVKGD